MTPDDIASCLEIRGMMNMKMFSDHLFAFINPSYSRTHTTHIHPKQFPRGLNLIAKLANNSFGKLLRP